MPPSTHAPEIQTIWVVASHFCRKVSIVALRNQPPSAEHIAGVFLCVLEGANRLGDRLRSTHTAITGENCRHGEDSTTDKVRGIIPLQRQTADFPRRLSPCVITYG